MTGKKKPVFYDLDVKDDFYSLEIEVKFDKKLFNTAILKAFTRFGIKAKLDEDRFYFSDNEKIITTLTSYINKILKDIEKDVEKVRFLTRKISKVGVNPVQARMRIYVSGACVPK